MKILIIYSIFLSLIVSNVNAVYCYWNTGCPYRFLSDKTPYNSARGDIRDGVVKLTGCEPVSIWGLARHGKIYPGLQSSSNMKDALVFKDYIISSYDQGRSSLCAQDVDNLRTWSPDSKMFGNTHELSEEGYKDSFGIGSRLKQAFPNLLEKLSEENYVLRPASGNWIEDSAKAFMNGLQNEQLVVDKARDDYDFMIPYKTCAKYQQEVLSNPRTYAETNKYHESPEFQAMKDRLRRRLGMDHLLDVANITALYDWCRYTWSGTDNKISPWCALLTTEDLKVLEYAEDLKHYYQNGYGSAMNELFGRIPMGDLLKHFQQVKEGNGKNIAMYFTENNMIEMVYTTLGLFKDKTALTGARKIPDRKWRNSKLSPFSSNIMAVLNRCGQDDYNVVFYHNEEPLIPICKEGVCTWREFENKLKPFLDANADFC